jgi:hypothetical protein
MAEPLDFGLAKLVPSRAGCADDQTVVVLRVHHDSDVVLLRETAASH